MTTSNHPVVIEPTDEIVENLQNSRDLVSSSVEKLYNSSRKIVKEFIEDGLISGFKDIDQLTWYNLLSSLCVIIRRFDLIKDDEKTKELVVFKTIQLVIEKDIPIDKNIKRDVLKVFNTVAPSIIDILIPGKIDPTKPPSLLEKVMNKICKKCGCGSL